MISKFNNKISQILTTRSKTDIGASLKLIIYMACTYFCFVRKKGRKYANIIFDKKNKNIIWEPSLPEVSLGSTRQTLCKKEKATGKKEEIDCI